MPTRSRGFLPGNLLKIRVFRVVGELRGSDSDVLYFRYAVEADGGCYEEGPEGFEYWGGPFAVS